MREAIGRCEGFCGLISHHLVKGLCPDCQNKAVDHIRDKPEREAHVGDDDVVTGFSTDADTGC